MSSEISARVREGSLTGWVGAAAVIFSLLYFLSDILERSHGGFSTPQLVLTYVAEAAIPVFVLGLYAVQRPHIGTLGLLGAVAQTLSAGVRDLAFAGMGIALLSSPRSAAQSGEAHAHA